MCVCFREDESARMSNARIQRPREKKGSSSAALLWAKCERDIQSFVQQCSLARPNKQDRGSGPHKDHFVSPLVPQVQQQTQSSRQRKWKVKKELRVEQNEKGGGFHRMSTLEEHVQYTGPSDRHIQNTVRLNEYHNSHQLKKKHWLFPTFVKEEHGKMTPIQLNL